MRHYEQWPPLLINLHSTLVLKNDYSFGNHNQPKGGEIIDGSDSERVFRYSTRKQDIQIQNLKFKSDEFL